MARMNATPLDVNGEPLDPFWAAEFRGYFFGDGYLGIVRNGKDRRTGLPMNTARAQITTRDDDAAMLHDISAKLGGKVSLAAASGDRKHHPVAIWRTRNMVDVARVCDALDGGLMPSKKRAEIAVVRRYLAIRIPPGPRTADFNVEALRAEREACIAEIQRLHAYRPVAA